MNTCRDCRWWAKPDDDLYAQCHAYGNHISVMPELRIKVPGDEMAILATHETFGCIQFEHPLARAE